MWQHIFDAWKICPTAGNPLSISSIDGRPRHSNKSAVFNFLFPQKTAVKTADAEKSTVQQRGETPVVQQEVLRAGVLESAAIESARAKSQKIGIAVDFQFCLHKVKTKDANSIRFFVETLYTSQVKQLYLQ